MTRSLHLVDRPCANGGENVNKLNIRKSFLTEALDQSCMFNKTGMLRKTETRRSPFCLSIRKGALIFLKSHTRQGEGGRLLPDSRLEQSAETEGLLHSRMPLFKGEYDLNSNNP